MEKIVTDLISDYSSWRSKKKTKNERIPLDLLTKTIKAQETFPDLNLKQLLQLSTPSWNNILSKVEGKVRRHKKRPGTPLPKDKFLKINGLESTLEVPSRPPRGDLTMPKTPALIMTVNNIQITIFN